LFFFSFCSSETSLHLIHHVKYTQQRASYTLEAIAEDRGTPPLSRTVEVEIDVVDRSNKPPVWDQRIYGPIYVKENTPVGETVTSVKARLRSSTLVAKGPGEVEVLMSGQEFFFCLLAVFRQTQAFLFPIPGASFMKLFVECIHLA